MGLLSFAIEHWEDLVALAALAGGALGFKRQRGRRVAQVEQVLGIALALCREILDGLRTAGRPADAATLDDWVDRFEQVASALGLELGPAQWSRVIEAVKAEMVTFNVARAQATARERAPELERLLRRIDGLTLTRAISGGPR